MKHSRILIGAFLSSALLAACGGNNTVPSTGTFAPPAGSFGPPGMTSAQLTQGVGAGSKLLRSNPSQIAPDQTAPDRGDGHIILFDDRDAGSSVGSACNTEQCGTIPEANNDKDTIVGFYTDSSYVQHGFIRWRSGDIKNFEAPGAGSGAGQGTVFRSINRYGWIAGHYQDSSGVYHGLVRKPDGTLLAPYNNPSAGTGSGQGTLTFDINAHGETAGNYYDSSGVLHGWVCSPDGDCKNFNPPSSSWLFSLVCEQTCLNFGGTVVGFYIGSDYQEHGFVRYRDGTINNIDVPGSGTYGTIVQSINNRGDIAGGYYDSNFVERGFILKHERSQHQIWIKFPAPLAKPINQPCARGTQVYSINDHDTTTGLFSNSVPTFVGFSRSSTGQFSKIKAGSSSGQCGGTQPSTNNNKDDVTGWFTDATGLNHGFVWTPDRS